MALYSHYQPKENDDFPTPIHAWKDIEEFIPRDKKIWCPFYFKGEHTLKTLGYDIIHENEDFFQHNKGDIVVDNPPFSIKKQVLTRMFEIDKPFILLLPTSTLNYQYSQKLMRDKKIQLIIPKKRINFKPEAKSSASFDCLYFCYKMGLHDDITYLPNKNDSWDCCEETFADAEE